MSAISALSALSRACSVSPFKNENGTIDASKIVFKHQSAAHLANYIAQCGLTEAATFAQGGQMARAVLSFATVASAKVQTVETSAEVSTDIKALLAN